MSVRDAALPDDVAAAVRRRSVADERVLAGRARRSRRSDESGSARAGISVAGT
jgi:hypothetical protein